MFTTQQLRNKYLDFFASKGGSLINGGQVAGSSTGHVIIPSASLLPDNDSTTLFTGSGMQPMVTYMLGAPHALGKRIADSQKCFRSQDIDEVGDNRHTVFFEMLGNWSLGDYFKTEQITWMWEFLTQVLHLNPERLYFTCFRGNDQVGVPKDTASAELWQNCLKTAGLEAKIIDFSERDGLQNGRIFYYDEHKNWWSRSGLPGSMPIGEPGGPDSEIFWDFGAQLKIHESSVFATSPCHVNCDCGRFLEIGNNVFMEYKKTANGFERLPQRNVDFGGGLERMEAAVNDNPDIFLIDVFNVMRHTLVELSGKKYGVDIHDTYAFRVIMDHLRAATFLVGDGAKPSNKDQGYFTRRLIRRAVRSAHQLGIVENFCGRLVEVVIAEYANQYMNLRAEADSIRATIHQEEEKFRKTLAQGLTIFEERTAGLQAGDSIGGLIAFDLYQTYGFPIEVIEELARERSLTVDRAGFDVAFVEHQEKSRAGAEQKFAGGLADHSEMSIKYHTATHLLQATLLKILGPGATQKGSNITPERMRFDFAYGQKMTPEQVKQAEALVNAAILRDYCVSWKEMFFEEAKAAGAIGLFEDKYQVKVKVYTIGDPLGSATADPAAPTFSREVCGGPHVEHTGTMGHFRIVKEEAVSAGVRRIKAVLE